MTTAYSWTDAESQSPVGEWGEVAGSKRSMVLCAIVWKFAQKLEIIKLSQGGVVCIQPL